ncbi:tail fiber protein [uncultured Aquimarina sp.]|uniref:tail fiber protein n=1 Tax=uncultured Aquimarina sp. TaxID=575652 RepID=UPI0026126268|nr:tail fiber protein [uncultured Aquimarina sp.]
MRNLLCSSITLILFSVCTSQTVDVTYLNPKITSDTNYEYLRFGNPSAYKGGLMWNKTSQYYGDGDDISLFTYNNRDLTFFTGTGNFIVFPHSGGNVGIGTANPQSKLHISNGSSGGIVHDFSDLTIEDNDNTMMNLLSPNNKTGYYGFSDPEDNYVGGIQYVHSTNSMIFRVNDHLNDMVIDANGNLGIGTTNPRAKLQVEGQTKVGKWGVLTLDWTNETNWGGSSNKWAGYIGFNSSRNNEDPKDHYKGTNKYTSKGVFEGSNYGFRWLYRNHNNYDSDAQHQLTEYMRLTNDGNLGIGVTNPDAKLTVKGNIHTQEVKVDLNGAVAPDYVFLEDYKLKSINEVEAYIKDQGHLPNIPSAAEMEENGIELKQMNLKLLEKIEELTLYTIAQEKELKKQEEKIKALEKQSNKIKQLEEKLELILSKQ